MIKSLTYAAVALAIGTTGASAESWKRVKTKEQFVSAVAGKKLSSDAGSGIVHANGTNTGTLGNGGKYTGNWVWDKGRYCRNLVINKKPTGTNCAHIHVSGKKVRFSYLDGRKLVSVWTWK